MKSFRFDHVRLKPDEQIGMHSQPTWELTYIVHGRGERTIGGDTGHFEEGEVVLVPPEVPHQWHFDKREEAIENISLQFPTEFLTRLAADFPEAGNAVGDLALVRTPMIFMGKALAGMRKIMTEMCGMDNAERLGETVRLVALAAESSEHAVVKAGEDVEWSKEVGIYISCNYRHKLTVAMAAAHFGMSRSSFCSAFRRNTGKTFIGCLNGYRLWVARTLLEKRSMTVSQVCFECGFNDVPYFTRLFRRTFGVSPRRYSGNVPDEPPLP